MSIVAFPDSCSIEKHNKFQPVKVEFGLNAKHPVKLDIDS